MRYRDIIRPVAETIGDTHEQRFAHHQQQAAKRTKLRTKIADAETQAKEASRRAAAARSRSNAKLADLHQQATAPKL